MKIVNENNAVLYSRKEYVVNIDCKQGATPKKDDIKKKIVDFLKAKSDVVVMGSYDQKFGGHNFNVDVKVYDSVDSLKANEKVKEKKVKEKKPEVKEVEKPKEVKENAKETDKEQKTK